MLPSERLPVFGAGATLFDLLRQTQEVTVPFMLMPSGSRGILTAGFGPAAIGILLLALVGSHEAQQLRSLRVELTAEESTYALRAPVYAVVSVENGLNEAIEFDFGRNSKSSFAFSLTLPDGRLIDVAYPSGDGGLSMITPRSLAPGETYKQRLLLNEWYDFSAPGAYTIQLKTDA